MTGTISRSQGIPEEELVAREVNGEELWLHRLGRKSRALKYAEGAGSFTSEELRGQRQEELVRKARGDQGVVQGSTALDEEHVHPVALLQGS